MTVFPYLCSIEVPSVAHMLSFTLLETRSGRLQFAHFKGPEAVFDLCVQKLPDDRLSQRAANRLLQVC